MIFNQTYWDGLYETGNTGWDIGYISTPLKEYIDQIENKSLKILVPGAGNGYETEYLYKNGFTNVFYNDFSTLAIENFKKRCPLFPEQFILNHDFFSLPDHFDIIFELAFFTSFAPEKREELSKKIYALLNPGGKYVGVFFNHVFGEEYPPFGAIKENYLELVKGMFRIKTFETAYNSIKPRAGRELFFIFEKK
jgi:thiopurine S-methyltransferase